MITLKNSFFASLLAIGTIATGCATDPRGDEGNGSDGGGNGGSNGGGDDVPHQLDLSGKYKMTSTFDVATNAPGTAGDIVNAVISATDDPDDPARWLLQELVAQLPNGSLKDALNNLGIPLVAGYLNDKLLDWAPDFVTTLKDLGNDFGQITKKFGLNETLEVNAGGVDGTLGATRTEIGAHFVINNQTFDLAFADHGIQNIVIPGVNLQMDQTGKVTIATHKVPLPYGGIIHLGLDAAVIPVLDPTATDLKTLLADKVDCAAVGQAVSDYIYSQLNINIGASVVKGACTAGLNAAASAIYAQIDKLNSTALEFDIDGVAAAKDTNSDYKVDTLSTGKWEGNLSYGTAPVALPAGSTFAGTRM